MNGVVRALALIGTGLVIGAWFALCMFAVWPTRDESCPHEHDPQ